MKLLDDTANYRVDKEENSSVVTCTLRVKNCGTPHTPLDSLPHIHKRERLEGPHEHWLRDTFIDHLSTQADIFICFG